MFNDHENTESFRIRNYYFKKMCYFRAHWPLSRWSGRVYLKWNPFPCLQSSYCWEAVELPSKSDLAPAPGVEKRLACWILGPEERLLAPSPGPGLQTYRFREGFSFGALTNPLTTLRQCCLHTGALSPGACLLGHSVGRGLRWAWNQIWGSYGDLKRGASCQL